MILHYYQHFNISTMTECLNLKGLKLYTTRILLSQLFEIDNYCTQWCNWITDDVFIDYCVV